MILESGSAVLTLPARAEEFPRLTEWLEELLAETGCPLKAAQQVLICADEIVTNIASYAYPGGAGDVTVTAEFSSAAQIFRLTFSDRGIPFDPLQQPEPEVSRPAADRKIGGLGLLVVRRMMDSVEYRREDGCNLLTLTKSMAASGGQGVPALDI